MERVHCYIICMVKRPERLASALEIKARLSLDSSSRVDIVDAVDGSTLTLSRIAELRSAGILAGANGPDDALYDMYGRKMKNGQYGCALSHIHVYRMISRQEREFGIIIEDDVKILDGFSTKLSNLLRDLKAVDMVNMYMWPHDKVKLSISKLPLGHLHRVPVMGYFGTQCIIYKKNSIDELLQRVLPLKNPIDDQIASIGMEYYTICNVDFCEQIEVDSTIY